MKIPYAKINFDPELDCASNSILIRKIRRLMKVDYNQESDSFTNGVNWRILIEDKHDEGESEPHYRFDFGEGDTTGIKPCAYRTRYCDYLSTADKSGKKGILETAPGEWIITIWVPDGFVKDIDELAKAINDIYAGAMEETLPQYEIMSSEPMYIEE
jgi:hypothetical protein